MEMIRPTYDLLAGCLAPAEESGGYGQHRAHSAYPSPCYSWPHIFADTYPSKILLGRKTQRCALVRHRRPGRDLFTRVLHGARISLSIGFVAALVALLGVFYGAISGFAGGWVDNVMMRIVDIMYSIPFLLWVIMMMVYLKEILPENAGLISMYIALALVYWLDMARIVRGQILTLKEQEFVLAAHTIGASRWRILLRHLIPNSMGPVIVTATLAIPEAIFTEAFLSFIGLGVSAPRASWGMLASDALVSLKSFPHLLFFPAAAICITLLAFNFLGDGLRDALDPKMRK